MLRCFSTGDSAARTDRVISQRNILRRVALFLRLARRLPHTMLAIGSPIKAVKGPDRSRHLALAARALSHGGTIMNLERPSEKNLVKTNGRRSSSYSPTKVESDSSKASQPANGVTRL